MIHVLIIHLQTAQAQFYWATTYYHTVSQAMAGLLPRTYTLLDAHSLSAPYKLLQYFDGIE